MSLPRRLDWDAMKTVLPWLWIVPLPLTLLLDLTSDGGWPILAGNLVAVTVALPALWHGQRAAARGMRPAALRAAAAALIIAAAVVALSQLLSLTVLWLSLVTLAHLARRFTDPLSLGLIIVLALSAVVVPGLMPGDGLTFAFGASTLVVAALALGLLMRMFDRSLVERHATAAEAERRRMATDLHDLVAHEVTGIVVLAQAASRAEDPTVLRAALGRIEESGSRALEEIRSLVVAPAGSDPTAHPPTGPAPTAPTAAGPEALERRLDEFGAGDDASTQSSVDLPVPVPTAVWPTLDRVLVEALTNVRRHAGPGAHVSMTIASTPDSVALTVDSTGGHGGIGRGGGTGLSGLRSRVESLGGDLAAGPHEEGTWRLEARLPLTGPATSDGAPPTDHPRPHTPETGDRR